MLCYEEKIEAEQGQVLVYASRSHGILREKGHKEDNNIGMKRKAVQ